LENKKNINKKLNYSNKITKINMGHMNELKVKLFEQNFNFIISVLSVLDHQLKKKSHYAN